MQKEEKMNFISKLYFGAFKRIGNLRLMFVISCLFALISLFAVSLKSIDRVYYYRVHAMLMPWEYYTLLSEVDSSVKFSDNDLETVFQLLARLECNNKDIAKAEYRYLGHDNGVEGCKRLEEQYKDVSRLTIYSFSYAWNYLWVIFWFYFPFLIVLPIKFVVDGYKQDKRKKK